MDENRAREVLTWLPDGVELMSDVTPADWVMSRLKPWDPGGARLESFAPDCFEAYARVFHPAGLGSADALGEHPNGIPWGELANERGVELSPDISFREVSGIPYEDSQAMDELAPSTGSMAPETCEALAEILTPHTTTPEKAWFCLWEGDGAFWSGSHSPEVPYGASAEETAKYRERAQAQDRLLTEAPRVNTYARAYFLFRGPLETVGSFEPGGWFTTPQLWWPQDRAWIVITEVDGYSSYVGADRATLVDLLASSDIEALEVPLDVHMDPEGHLPFWR